MIDKMLEKKFIDQSEICDYLNDLNLIKYKIPVLKIPFYQNEFQVCYIVTFLVEINKFFAVS